MRIGIGYDVHQLQKGESLVLGGVHIPAEKGLAGHSDADVLTHALMDALLGAMGKGDIGLHFPDTDEKYKGISSLVLLEEIKKYLLENDYIVENIDMIIMAEKPRLAPYIQEMKDNIAGVLDISSDRINIKATTTEKLGFVGREEGMAAEVVVLLNKEKN
ncbi:MAG: 2-C-methyl-D-erythritol 2,4-cyclodiphosphate synthase [Halanaerobiaceae bacterium]|nr:2-C-methyl-D-erythritol 2,4-cyclodiphosphate synthase [Halanaerobiaceae bacterium]